VVRCAGAVDLAQFGRRCAGIFVDTAHLPPPEREKAAQEKILRTLVLEKQT
jgi:hypothetical protein